MSGRVIHTGQAVVDLVMQIEALPEPGGDVFATQHEFAAGGGFNVMAAAARDGAQVIYVGGHGTGPFGDIVRAAMAEARVAVLAPVDPTQDTGFSVALVEASAERTFISTLGAEGYASIDHYRAVTPTGTDVVYVSGYSLLHPANRAALLEWLPQLEPEVTVVVDSSPVIGDVPLPVLTAVAARADIWSTNLREATILADRLGIPQRAGTTLEVTATQLSTTLGAAVILRTGADGALVVPLDGQPVQVPAPAVHAVDTNGAGDAHTGVLCAALGAGADLVAAVRRATTAAALAVTRRGPATAPTRVEIDRALG